MKWSVFKMEIKFPWKFVVLNILLNYLFKKTPKSGGSEIQKSNDNTVGLGL